MWLIYQMHFLSLLLEQEDLRLITTLRNALGLFIGRPGFNMMLALVLGILIVLSSLLVMPWFFLTLSLIAIICNRATKHLLVPHRERIARDSQETITEENDSTS
jgi:hypothetical protein